MEGIKFSAQTENKADKPSSGLAQEYEHDLKSMVDQIKSVPDDYRNSDPRMLRAIERVTQGRFEGREVVGNTVINVYLEPDVNDPRHNKYVLFFPQIFKAVEEKIKQDPANTDPFKLKATGVESAEIGHMDLGLYMSPEKQDALAKRVFNATKLLADTEKFGQLKPEEIFAMATVVARSFEDQLRK